MAFGLLRRRRTVPAKDGASWPHVVIIGGGFAGANAVLGLRDTRVRVTLIDRNMYKTFQPLLYQVATAGLNPGDVTMMLRSLSLTVPNMRYRQGEVVGVDPTARTVRIDGGEERLTEIPYDYLVLAGGATTTFFGTPGAEEHAMPMYTRSQALAIRERLFSELERASREAPATLATDPAAVGTAAAAASALGAAPSPAGASSTGNDGADGRRATAGHRHTFTQNRTVDRLHVSVVGGGPTGVEIAGALADFRQQELDILYPEMDPGTLQVTLVQRGTELIKEFRPSFRAYAARELRSRGVELRLGHGVKSVGYDHIELDDGTILESDITIWAAGVAIPESVTAWGFPQDRRGRIDVDETLQVKGFPGVYAAGDMAGGDNAQPQLAQPAIQTGSWVAKMIHADVTGGPKRPFRYVNLGTMATIGRRAAIAEIPHFPDLSGSVGWMAWMGVHVGKLLGHRNRRAVAMNLLSLYGGTRATHQPNPVIGEVDSISAARRFRAEAANRRFGEGAGGAL